MNNLLDLVHSFWLTSEGGIWIINPSIMHYIVLAILVAVEGPLMTLLGAAASSAGFMQPGWVFTAAAIGNLSADLIWFSVGYLGKIEWAYQYGNWLGLKRQHIEKIQAHIHSHAAKVLFLAKLSAGLMIPSLIAAGLAKVPIKKWLPALLIGETLWTGSLVLCGYYATEAIKQVEKGVHYIGIGVSIFIILGIGIWVVRHFIKEDKDIVEINDSTNSALH